MDGWLTVRLYLYVYNILEIKTVMKSIRLNTKKDNKYEMGTPFEKIIYGIVVI